ncbi:MAG: hypothetical protein ABFS23_01165 [Pseudomonadota bacterium]
MPRSRWNQEWMFHEPASKRRRRGWVVVVAALAAAFTILLANAGILPLWGG